MCSFRFFSVALLLFFLSESSVSLAQQGQVATRSEPYRIGIFPAAGNFGSGNQSTQEVRSADILRARVSIEKAFTLAYSAYHEELGQPRIAQGGKVWTDDAVRKKPRLTEINKLARERRLDGVVLAWGDSVGWVAGRWGERGDNPVFVYMVDIERQKIYVRKGTFDGVPQMAQQVFADFLRDRPPVIQAQATPPVPPTASKPPAPAAAQQRSKIKPGAVVPGETIGSPLLQRDTLTTILLLDGAADSCQERKIVDTRMLKVVKPSKVVGQRVLEGSWIELWYLDRCGQQVQYEVTYTADGVGGTKIDIPRPTAPATPAAGASREAPYRLGIFPASGCFASDGSVGCGWIGEKETAHAFTAHIRRDPALELSFSHYDEILREPRIRNPEQLWKGNTPNLPAVYRLAEEKRIDAVLMYRGSGDFGGGNILAKAVPVTIYLIDVSRRQQRTYDAMTDTVSQTAARVLADFVRNRPPVMQARASALQAETAVSGRPSAPLATAPRPVSPTPPSAGPGRQITVPTNTQVFLVLDDMVSSGGKDYPQSQVGEIVRAHMWRDIEVDGYAVIRAGTPVLARVGDVRPARRAGARGAVRVDAVSVAATDGSQISLTGGYGGSGEGSTGKIAGAWVMIGAFALLLRGEEAVVEPGTIFDAVVLQPAIVTVYGLPRPKAEPDANPPLAVAILYDNIYPDEKLKELPVRVRRCSAPVSDARVVGVNGSSLAEAIPVKLNAAQSDGPCMVAEGTIKMRALFEHFTKGINRFDIEAGGVRKEVLLEMEF